MRALLRTVLALIFIAAVVWLAVFLADRPGNVAIQWQGYEIETSVAVMTGAVVIAAFIVMLLWAILRAIFRSPAAWTRGRRAKRRQDGYRALTQGMVAVAAGDAEEAQKLARKADSLLADPPLTLLLSAQAAQLNGDESAAKRYFTAMLERPETEFLGLRGLIMQALKSGDEATALTLTERAKTLRPKTPWVMSSLLELQARAGKWQPAESTLAEATRRKTLNGSDGRHRQAVVLQERSSEAEAQGHASDAMRLQSKAQGLEPGFAPVASRYARMMMVRGQTRPARRALEAAWKASPQPLVAEAWETLYAEETPLLRVKRVESLTGFNPNHVESHIARARAALAAKLWGEARRHLASAYSGGAENAAPRICRLMAEIEEGEHGDLAAAHTWLERATDTSVLDPAWVCDVCGYENGDWSALCASCRSFATLAWRDGERPAPTRYVLDTASSITLVPMRG